MKKLFVFAVVAFALATLNAAAQDEAVSFDAARARAGVGPRAPAHGPRAGNRRLRGPRGSCASRARAWRP